MRRGKDTWVLDRRYDDTTAAFCGKTAKSQIVRFGTTAGKERRIALHALGAGFAELEQQIACILDGGSRRTSGRVLARGVDEPLAQNLSKMLCNTRIDLSGGIIVEINHGGVYQFPMDLDPIGGLVQLGRAGPVGLSEPRPPSTASACPVIQLFLGSIKK